MQKRHFEDAAKQVKAIVDGKWTFDPPSWCDHGRYQDIAYYDSHDELSARYLRAVWTAEAYIELFERYNPRFDRDRFIKACGL